MTRDVGDGPRTERALAAFLKWGTLAAALPCLAGVAVMAAAGPGDGGLPALAPCPFPCREVPGGPLALAGVAALLAVGAGRLLLASGLYFRQGDRLYGAVALGGFLLVAAAAGLAALQA